MSKPDEHRRLLVLTKYKREYDDFCHRHELNPRDRSKVMWMRNPDDLRGLRDEWLLILDGGLSPDYVQHLVDIYGFIIVPEPKEETRRPPAWALPEIKAVRGGIRFPTPEKRELEGTFL